MNENRARSLTVKAAGLNIMKRAKSHLERVTLGQTYKILQVLNSIS